MFKPEKHLHLEIIKDNFDAYAEGVNLLLVANAPGLVRCVSTLKDYSLAPMLKGIGVSIVLFGAGLLFGTSAYVGMAASRIEKTTFRVRFTPEQVRASAIGME